MTSTGPRRRGRARTPRSGGRLLLHAVGALYAAFTLAALAAWAVVGDTWWTQPVNLSTFWWTLPAVLLAPLLWIAGSRRLAPLIAIPALVWVWAYGGAFLPKDAPGPADVRVASYNTYVGAPDADHVVAFVERYEPDILLLQEVFPDRQQSLESALADRYQTATTIQSPGVGGVSVFSRYPLVETRPVGDATERSRSTQVVVLDADGQRLQVVSVHLISPCPTCGRSAIERLELEGDVRRAEMSTLVAALDPGVPAIIGGDFNSTERSEPYRRLTAAGFRDPQREAGDGPGFTWPNDRGVGPLLRIDWLLARGLTPVEAWVADGGPSDHRPVLAEFTLPEED